MTHFKTFITTVCLLFGSTSLAQFKSPSHQYAFYKAEISQGPLDPQSWTHDLRKYHVILIPGLLAQSTFADQNQPNVNLFFGVYFEDFVTWLRHHHISHQRLILESEGTPERNALKIKEAILKAPKPVLIFSHSKGSLDFLEAMNQDPALTKKVHVWISSQGPVWGTWIADLALDFVFPEWLTRVVVKFVFGGSYDGLESLKKRERHKVMLSDRYQQLFRGPLKEMTKLSYASFDRQQGYGPSFFLELLRHILAPLEGENDGLVSIESAYVPNSVLITEKGVDHISTVVGCYYLKTEGRLTRKTQACKFDRMAHAGALMRMGLEIERNKK
jgi:hypothetical protein